MHRHVYTHAQAYLYTCTGMSIHMHRHVYTHAQACIFVKVVYCQALKETLLLFLLFNFNLFFLIYLSSDKCQRSCCNEGIMYVICVWSKFCFFWTTDTLYAIFQNFNQQMIKFYSIELVTSRDANNHWNFALNPTVSLLLFFFFTTTTKTNTTISSSSSSSSSSAVEIYSPFAIVITCHPNYESSE